MKKLIPALCMLLIAAALLGTSTYAWFSMNSSVTASGMSITAKSDSVFLQIVKDGVDFKDNEAQVSAEITYTNSEAWPKLKPTAAVGTLSSPATDGTVTITAPLADTMDFSGVNFVEAFSADPSVSTNANTGKYYDVTANAKDGTSYTHLNDFKVRLNPTAGATVAYNLTVSGVTIKSTNSTANDAMLSAVRVLVVCGNEWAIFDSTGVKISSNNKVIAATVGTTATKVSVYIYFDGEDGNATTNQATELSTDGYTVGVNFTVGATNS